VGILKPRYSAEEFTIFPFMHKKTGLLAFSLISPFLIASPGLAQIAADGSLSTTVNSLDGRNFTIEQGDRSGNHLFHSFQEFSVPTQGSAVFNNAADIQNIITRVTGNSISNIDGLIRANGSANLFLINPNGIIFGANAQLAIGGSFVGSTANRLRFADGTEFGVGDRGGAIQSALLTVSAPVGLLLGGEPGKIQVDGMGTGEPFPTTNFGLAVAPGRSFALVGGNLELNGGIVTASRIDLSSVANGEVRLVPNLLGWQMSLGEVQSYGDIHLSGRSLIWSPYPVIQPSDGVQIQGRDIRLDNAQVATVTLSDQNSSPITVNATNSLDLRGVNSQAYPFSSWITTQVNAGASGQGGNVQITSPNLSLQDGAMIQTATQGSGRAGNVRIDAGKVQISGYSPLSANPELGALLLNSRIASETSGDGAGGDINLVANRVNFENGGQVRVMTAPTASGNSGNIRVNVAGTINAREAYLVNPLIGSGVSALNFGTGNSGDITVVGDRLNLRDGGSLFSFNQSSGAGGDVTVRMRGAIDSRRTNPRYPILSSTINASTLGVGNGGQLSVSAPRITLQDGAEIGTYTLSQLNGITFPGAGTGNAGNVRVRAMDVTVQGTSSLSVSRASIVGSITLGEGNGGNVKISAQRVRVLDGATLSSGVLPSTSLIGAAIAGSGSGRGGEIQVNATELVEVSGVRSFENSDLSTYSFGSGDAGNVEINTPFLLIERGGGVATTAIASGDAGRLTVRADEIKIRGIERNNVLISSGIGATAELQSAEFRRAYFAPPVPTGNTGVVDINAGHLTLERGGNISVEHGGTGNAGRLRIRAHSLVNQGGDIIAVTASGRGGSISLQIRDLLSLRDRAQLTATAGGSGNGGNIIIDSPLIITTENSDIVANAVRGQGGNIAIDSEGIFGTAYRSQLTANSDITASSQFNLAGSVTITTPNLDPTSAIVALPNEVVDSTQQIAASCAAAQENAFVVTGRGGLPEEPQEILESDRPWSDLRDLESFQNLPERDIRLNEALLPLAEATQWITNAQGQIQLITISNGARLATNLPVTCAVAD
jgi:filamentous hemagglutinin family protein